MQENWQQFCWPHKGWRSFRNEKERDRANQTKNQLTENATASWMNKVITAIRACVASRLKCIVFSGMHSNECRSVVTIINRSSGVSIHQGMLKKTQANSIVSQMKSEQKSETEQRRREKQKVIVQQFTWFLCLDVIIEAIKGGIGPKGLRYTQDIPCLAVHSPCVIPMRCNGFAW